MQPHTETAAPKPKLPVPVKGAKPAPKPEPTGAALPLEVDALQMKRALGRLAYVIDQEPELPILAFARADVADGKLTVTGFDGDTRLTISIPCEGEAAPFLIPVHRFKACFKMFKQSSPVRIGIDGENLRGARGALTFHVKTANLTDWPEAELPKAQAGFTVDAQAFGWAIESCEPSMSADEEKDFELCGVNIAWAASEATKGRKGKKTPGVIRVAATDLHYLGRTLLTEAADHGKLTPHGISGTIPAKAVRALCKLLFPTPAEAETVTVTQAGTWMTVAGGHEDATFRVDTRTIDGFPVADIERIVANTAENTHSAMVRVEDLSKALDRLATVFPKGAPRIVQVRAEKRWLRLSAVGTATEATESVDADIVGGDFAFPVSLFTLTTAAWLSQSETVTFRHSKGGPVRIEEPAQPDLVFLAQPAVS